MPHMIRSALAYNSTAGSRLILFTSAIAWCIGLTFYPESFDSKQFELMGAIATHHEWAGLFLIYAACLLMQHRTNSAAQRRVLLAINCMGMALWTTVCLSIVLSGSASFIDIAGQLGYTVGATYLLWRTPQINQERGS